MRRIHATTIIAIAIMMAAGSPSAISQVYSAPAVTVSKEKVRQGGKIYYSHIVQEKQTLYSISKAYGVTLQEIYDSNPTLNLETEGLKKDQVILIPVNENLPGAQAESKEQSTSDTAIAPLASTDTAKTENPQEGDYFFHKVKWYEDLDAIAAKYNVSKTSIMNINGMTSDKVAKKETIKIPRNPSYWEHVYVPKEEQNTETAIESVPETSIISNEEPAVEEKSIKEGSDKVSIGMLLPFNIAKKTDKQIMDFYCGALMGAKNLGKEGTSIDLNVYDISGGAMPLTREEFAQKDFIIGPVGKADILRAVKACDGETWIVSPLDPSAEAVADTVRNLIQAPSSVKDQIEDMLAWIKDEMKAGDKVIVLTQKGAAATSYSSSIINAVKASGIAHSTLTFNVLEGRGILTSMENMMTKSGCNRIIIASDNKPFVMEAVRNLYLMSSQKTEVKLYATSKLRSFEGSEGVDAQQLHALNLHMSASYFVDYDAKDVQNFIYQYRALFNAEPSQSAYQGYDMVTAFSNAAHKYGSRLDKGLVSRTYSGLQTDIRLEKTGEGGYVNKAVRRVTYTEDYKIEVSK